ncbi:helix-turn-helix transcriptional regulator [Streptomyces neyagawaensis]|uniref:helix-turn-helix transcriptional regulator n=2 Tax=Streptomyces neyagawaensis TaxID=42238 RepID=UPI00201D2542|nr:WYL domain-containing protein [Streptomyces neyagawaensis]MCL6734183.1 WYL domain-containing protein [Streptomyces neyagawaensis]MDE1681117.1 WYL domain-containing protein [Streptomyces neyagawaensis]
MLETSGRLLRLLALLQTHRERDRSGAELAEHLGVSRRTLRRDVERLRDLGYPVHAARGAAGYRLGAGASLPPLLLDDEEAVAVVVGLRTAADGTVAGIEEASLRALSKLEQVLPSRLRHRVTTLHTATVRAGAAPAPTVSPDTLMTIAEACRRREHLRFTYTSPHVTSPHTAEPPVPPTTAGVGDDAGDEDGWADADGAVEGAPDGGGPGGGGSVAGRTVGGGSGYDGSDPGVPRTERAGARGADPARSGDIRAVRCVEPYNLVSFDRRWYLVAWDLDRADWRTFRVDRLVPRTPTGPRFAPRPIPEGDAATYLAHRLSSRTWPVRATVTLHEPVSAVADRVWPGMGVLEPLDDHSCLLHLGADTPRDLAWMITSVDADFSLAPDAPPELTEALHTQATRCLSASASESLTRPAPQRRKDTQ